LADAVQVLLLMLEADDPAFVAATVRWIHQRVPRVTLGESSPLVVRRRKKRSRQRSHAGARLLLVHSRSRPSPGESAEVTR
jgi:hypothetical protein